MRDLERVDHIGKIVGRRLPLPESLVISPADTKQGAREWADAFGRYPVKKGVYRFFTHEEANLWMIKLAAKRGAMNIRETQALKTL